VCKPLPLQEDFTLTLLSPTSRLCRNLILRPFDYAQAKLLVPLATGNARCFAALCMTSIGFLLIAT
jgi:hypothetical protein